MLSRIAQSDGTLCYIYLIKCRKTCWVFQMRQAEEETLDEFKQTLSGNFHGHFKRKIIFPFTIPSHIFMPNFISSSQKSSTENFYKSHSYIFLREIKKNC